MLAALALFVPFGCPHTALIVPLLLYVHHVNSALSSVHRANGALLTVRSPR